MSKGRLMVLALLFCGAAALPSTAPDPLESQLEARTAARHLLSADLVRHVDSLQLEQ